jgi:acetyl-CoA acetyltransferase family protein
MGDAVILSAVRSAIGTAFKGSLAFTSVYDIGGPVVLEALKRSGVDPGAVDDMILGEVLAGGGDIARYLAVELGLPDDLPGAAVNRQCASGMAAVDMAAASIMAGMDTVVIAGGVASMSGAPVSYLRPRMPFAMPQEWLSPSHPDTPDAPNMNMMITVGENTADAVGVTREEMDEWAYGSHMKAIAATDDGRFAHEIVPVEATGFGGDTTTFAVDEHPRRTSTLEKLASLPVISGRPDGRVTAGNSSGINDGAAALVVADRAWVEAQGHEPLAVVRSWASVGVAPRDTGLGPSLAIPRALERAGLTLADVDLVEVNEAFASMAVGTVKRLDLDPDIVNVNGGAVGLGHPVACSGARILVTLIHELGRRGGGIGVASLCAGGGMGAATVVEVMAT